MILFHAKEIEGDLKSARRIFTSDRSVPVFLGGLCWFIFSFSLREKKLSKTYLLFLHALNFNKSEFT